MRSFHQNRQRHTNINKEPIKVIVADCKSLFGSGFAHVPAKDGKPEHWHVRLFNRSHGVDVHLRDGLTPSDLAVKAVRAEIKVRKVDYTDPSDTREFVYLNLFPTDGAAECRIIVDRDPSEDPAVIECHERLNGAVNLLALQA